MKEFDNSYEMFKAAIRMAEEKKPGSHCNALETAYYNAGLDPYLETSPDKFYVSTDSGLFEVRYQTKKEYVLSIFQELYSPEGCSDLDENEASYDTLAEAEAEAAEIENSSYIEYDDYSYTKTSTQISEEVSYSIVSMECVMD